MYGEPSCENPWKSNTLEWTTEIIPVHGNWQGSLPVIQRWAYDYSKPGKENDYVPQTVPLEPGDLDEGMFEGEINNENRA